MTTINLQQSRKPDEGQNKIKSSMAGLYFSLSLPIIMVLIYGGLKVYESSFLQPKINQKMQDIENIKNQISSGQSIEKILDMQSRIAAIKEGMKDRVDINEVLNDLQANVVQGVIVKKIDFTNPSSVIVSLGSNDYPTASKQIDQFKNAISTFSRVSLNNIVKSQNNISFEISLVLK